MRTTRPRYLNVARIKQPIPAIVSILHRVSGILLSLFIPLVLWALQFSLGSADNFTSLKQFFLAPSIKFLLWVCLSALIYHILAGVRHLLMDMHIGEELQTSRWVARLVMLLGIAFAIIIGIWLW